MFSVTETGRNLLPLYTPKVSPTNCGRIVERRDQILMISLRPDAREASALLRRYPSTNGPFHTERAILVLPLRAAADDQLVRPLVLASLVTLGRLAPRRDR